jgi:proteasome lid subunit RPN8/RPN11
MALRWTPLPPQLPFQRLHTLPARLPPGDVAAFVASAGATGQAAPLQVLVPADIHATVLEHLSRSMDEQGGLLVGEVYTDDGTAPGANVAGTVLLTRAVAALDFASSGYALRMESQVWERARQSLTAGDLIVGWYHSHPDLGAFFSSTDRRTQAAFFGHAWSVGWVMDPVRREDAYFVGPDCVPLGPAESGPG